MANSRVDVIVFLRDEASPVLRQIRRQMSTFENYSGKSKCSHCQQWNEPKATCKFCGAPVD